MCSAGIRVEIFVIKFLQDSSSNTQDTERYNPIYKCFLKLVFLGFLRYIKQIVKCFLELSKVLKLCNIVLNK